MYASIARKSAAEVSVGLIYNAFVIPDAPPVWLIVDVKLYPTNLLLPEDGLIVIPVLNRLTCPPAVPLTVPLSPTILIPDEV
jgi:hypothetical protein